MASKKKTRAKASDALKDARAKHRRLAEKLEATKAKLEKRSRKLLTLESKIAKLERRAFQSGGARRTQAANDDKKLRPAFLIYNPKSGAKAKNPYPLEKIVKVLRAHGIRAKTGIKTSSEAARRFAKAAVANDEKLVIVAGGDSTIEEVVPELIGSKTALGILAAGTMNNVARSLGIPLDLDDACALLGAGSTRQVDVGHIIGDEKPKVEYFMETVGLGLTGIVFSAVQAAQKGRLGGLPHALRKFFDSKPGPVQIELDDGETILASSQLVTVSNAPLMGLNFLIAPMAKMDDGLLDVAVYEDMGKTDLLAYFVAISNGKRADNPNIKYYRARKVRIRSRSSDAVDADKNALPDQKVLDIELLSHALTMVAGKGVALELPIKAVQSVPPLSGPQPPRRSENGGAKIKHKPKPEQAPEPGDAAKP